MQSVSASASTSPRTYPVRPAAHYMCGGIKVDLNGCSSINRLYALGECSCTGLHGGNRLASNSLIEAVVYADTAAKHSIEHVDEYDFNDKVPEWNDEGTHDQRGEGAHHPERQGSGRMHEQLCGHREKRPPTEACLGPSRPAL